MNIAITPAFTGGAVAAPPSKSMAHRALICAALAGGDSRITGLAPSQDITATARALAAFGARITPIPGGLRVTGVAGRPAAPQAPVDCGESGSTLRFLIPLASLCGAPVTFTGHGRLMERPQGVYRDLFRARGLRFEQRAGALTLQGPLPAGAYTVDGGVSSQFVSGLLLALPLLGAPSTLAVTPPFESKSYVDLTLAAMARAGVRVEHENPYSINGNQIYNAYDFSVEGDWSQAAFFAVLGAARGGIALTGLDEGSRQGDRVILDILRRCGARVRQEGGALCFDAAPLRAVEADLADCPDLGPILMVLGLLCQGRTVLHNARRLRLKESDRVAAMEQEIRKLGGRIESDENTVRVWGGPLHGGALDAHNDHRVAMAMAVASLGAGVSVTIAGAGAVAKSYPDFWDVLQTVCAEGSIHETA